MTAWGALAFLLAVFVFGITPGPGIAALLARSLSQGYKACWGMALGMTLSDIAYLLMAVFGLAAMIQQWQSVFVAVQIIGGFYLIYLGVMMWKKATALQVKTNHSAYGGVLQGLMISASNPKVVLFYLAFMPAFMDLNALSGADIILAVALTFFGLMTGLMLVSYLADRMKQVLKSPDALTRLNRVAGSIMMLAGLFLLLR